MQSAVNSLWYFTVIHFKLSDTVATIHASRMASSEKDQAELSKAHYTRSVFVGWKGAGEGVMQKVWLR
jgi:hypothetical protein